MPRIDRPIRTYQNTLFFKCYNQNFIFWSFLLLAVKGLTVESVVVEMVHYVLSYYDKPYIVATGQITFQFKHWLLKVESVK